MLGNLYLGKNKKGDVIEYPKSLIDENLGIIGKTGSGKSVLIKSIVEECIRLGIPSFVLDRSGDMVSIGLKHQNHEEDYYESWEGTIKENMDLRLFTLSSRSAIPVGITLFPDIEVWADYPHFKYAIKNTVDILLQILNLGIDAMDERFLNKYLQELIGKLYEEGKPPKEIISLRNLIISDNKYLPEAITNIISDELKAKVLSQINSIRRGSGSLIFDFGVPFRVDELLQSKDGTPVNVFHLLSQSNREAQYQFILYFMAKIIHDLDSLSRIPNFVIILDNIVDLFPNKRGYYLFIQLINILKSKKIPLIFTSSDPSNLDPYLIDQTPNFFVGNVPYSSSLDYIKYRVGGGVYQAKNFDNSNNQFQLIGNEIEIEDQLILPRLISDHRTLSNREIKSLSDELLIASKWRREFNR